MLLWMRRWIWFVLPLIGLVGWWLLQPKPTAAPEALPSATLQRLDGPAVQLSDFKGKPIVLNAWATWCGPCRREMPLLVEAARAHPGIQFIFLNISDGPEAVKAFQRELKLQIPNVLLDPEATLSDPLRIQGLPVTLFYNAEGVLVNRHIGEIKAETLEALLKAL